MSNEPPTMNTESVISSAQAAQVSAAGGEPAQSRVFDLAERTAVFAESIIDMCKSLKVDIISRPLINQILKSPTSVGANYCEADEAVSRKEFRVKIGTCKKGSA